jgi:hypothetical protein
MAWSAVFCGELPIALLGVQQRSSSVAVEGGVAARWLSGPHINAAGNWSLPVRGSSTAAFTSTALQVRD